MKNSGGMSYPGPFQLFREGRSKRLAKDEPAKRREQGWWKEGMRVGTEGD